MSEVTIRDIAKMCKVGVSTVSRAINNHPDINPETKQMIMETIQRYEYIPNNSARNLKRTDAKSIAVLVKGITNPFFGNMIKLIEEEIKGRRYTMVLHHVEFNEDEVDVAIELVKEKKVSGLIFLGGCFSDSCAKLEKIQIPYVLSASGAIPKNFDKEMYSSVTVDDVKESQKIVSYMIEQGHKKIAILVEDTEETSIGSLRLQGYQIAHKEHGLKVNKRLIRTLKEEREYYTMYNGYLMTKELLNSGEEFTAIYGTADVLAIGACRAIYESGKSIPEDYSVAGYDGLEMCDYYKPSLTSLRQPVEEMAEETILLLFDLIDGISKNRHKIFEGEISKKESVKKIK